MSGQKVTYARITTGEFERLQRSARIADNMDSKIRNAVSSKEYELRNEFQSRLDNVNRRNSEQSRLINNMSDSMRDMERDFQREFQEQSSRHRRDFSNLNNKIDLEVEQIHNRLDSQRREYTTLIEKQGKILNNKINDLRQSIEQREANKENQAKTWLDDVNSALAIVDTYNHKKFAPNEYDELKARLQISQTNINNGVFEASISNSQTVWMDAYKLRAKLEQLENEWNAYFELAKESNVELIATCEAHEVVKFAFETEDGDESLEANIDYWSNGELNRLKAEAIKIDQKLANADEFTVNDLKQMIQNSIELKEKVIALTDLAKNNIILHEKRMHIADDITGSLEERGYEVTDDCYDYDDSRESYRVKFENSLGEEVVTIITPKDNQTNQLNIHFFDKSVNEDERKTRLNDMLQSLKEDGVECDQPQCIAGTQFEAHGNETEKDFEAVKNKKKQTI